MIITLFNNHTIIYRDFLYFGLDYFSLLLHSCCIYAKGLTISLILITFDNFVANKTLWENTFPHTTNLQQMTLKTSEQKYEPSPLITIYLLNRVENIVANGKVAHHEQFHLCHNVFKSRLLQRLQKMST